MNDDLHPLLKEIIKAKREGRGGISLDTLVKSLEDDKETLKYVIDKVLEKNKVKP